MATNDQLAYLGRGWAFPARIDPETGQVAMVEGVDCVGQSVYRLIGIAVGSMVMRRTIGSEAQDSVFAPLNTEMIQNLVGSVRSVISVWEKRVSRTNFTVSVVGSTLNIEVEYEVAGTNQRGNVVYPFYLED